MASGYHFGIIENIAVNSVICILLFSFLLRQCLSVCVCVCARGYTHKVQFCYCCSCCKVSNVRSSYHVIIVDSSRRHIYF